MVDTATFWDRVAAKYSRRPVKDQASYATTLERTRAHLTPDSHVLEVGCGTGTTALWHAEHVAQITGSDISGQMIEIARAKAMAQKTANVTFRQAVVDDHVAAGETYDVVLALNFLHLLEDVPGTVAQIHRLVKPGGFFISKTGCLGRRNIVLKALIGVMQFFGKAPYVAFLDTGEVDSIIADQGFEIIETGNFPASPPSHFVVARKL